MAAERTWGWNLDEMRSSAGMDSSPGAQTLEFPTVSGFTPINAPRMTQAATDLHPTDKNASNTKAERSKVPKRSRTKAPTTEPAAKARKTSGVKKGKGAPKAEQLQCKDVSEGLALTKPSMFGDVAPHSKAATASSEAPLLGNYADAELLLGALGQCGAVRQDGASNAKFHPSGLAGKYQSAYAFAPSDGVDPSTLLRRRASPEAPENVEEQIVTNGFLEPATSESTVKAEIKMEDRSQNYDDISVQDFAIPPSAQGDNSVEVATASSIWKEMPAADGNLLNGDGCFGDYGEADEFPADDEGFAEFMRSVDRTEALEGPDDDWRPQEFTDDPLIFGDLDFEETQRNKSFSPRESDRTEETTRLALNDEMTHVPSNSQNALAFRVLSQTSRNATKASPKNPTMADESESCFDDDDLDESLVDMRVDGSDAIQPRTPLTSPEKASTPKLQWMAPKAFTPAARSSQVPVSPMDVPHLVPTNKSGNALPFTRPPLPKPIRDRSPVLGLTNRTFLRTSFRIGEALNAAAVASRSNFDAIIELYARIVLSERESNGGFKQFFQFGDLFTDKPPYLSGTYNLWKGVELWDHDSRVFIGEKGKGKMARVMGRIKRCGKGGGCEMMVLSIWEVDWEEVGVAKGIVCS